MRSLTDQLDHLVELGVPRAIGLPADRLREVAASVVGMPGLRTMDAGEAGADGAVLVLHPSIAPASALAPLLDLGGRPGFVVPDMTDLVDFTDIDGLGVPDRPVYAVVGVERGDDLADWTPDDALPEILARGRTPLTVNEGICWLLQEPGMLERNHCFMTVGSRKRKGLGPDRRVLDRRVPDRRVPALWISGGAERDGGRERRGAPKLGWCWAGNRHTWLGFASASARIG